MTLAAAIPCPPPLIRMEVETHSGSIYSWTELKKEAGNRTDVSLASWHNELPPDTEVPLMQSTPGVRPQWSGLRVVAVKRHKATYPSWTDCELLNEVKVRAVAQFHGMNVN